MNIQTNKKILITEYPEQINEKVLTCKPPGLSAKNIHQKLITFPIKSSIEKINNKIKKASMKGEIFCLIALKIKNMLAIKHIRKKTTRIEPNILYNIASLTYIPEKNIQFSKRSIFE